MNLASGRETSCVVLLLVRCLQCCQSGVEELNGGRWCHDVAHALRCRGFNHAAAIRPSPADGPGGLGSVIPIPCINTQHVSLVWAEYCSANLLLMITTCDSTKVKSLGYKYTISIYYDRLSLASLIYKGQLIAYFERPLINSFGFWALWEYRDLVPVHRLQNYLWLFETVYFLYVWNLF